MGFIAPLLGLAGTAVSAVGQLSSGNAADAAAKNNAAIAVEQAGIRESQQRLADSRTLATDRALVGSSGVEFSGSPLDVVAEQARQSEMNALNIRRGGQLDANAQLVQGTAIKKASQFNAASTILTGGVGVGKQLAILGQNKLPPKATPTTSYDPNTGLMY